MIKDPLDVHLGTRLNHMRAARGLSMSEVGRKLGMSYQQVGKYEAGENRISAATLFRLAEMLGVDVEEFLDGAPGGGRATTDNRSVAAPPSGGTVAEAISVIDSPEVRRHLESLIRILGKDG